MTKKLELDIEFKSKIYPDNTCLFCTKKFRYINLNISKSIKRRKCPRCKLFKTMIDDSLDK